jgi:nitrate/nitrite-specific signal transduction histidine kinase
MLERYAIHVGGALRNARIHERKRELADALTRLQETSRDMQRSAAFYEPHQMIELIGRSAETLLKADIVMIYTLDEAKDELALPFITENAIHGRGTLTLNLDQGILAKIYRSGKNYFSTNARQDPALVNLKPDGRPDNSRRTFTQRQNIKSFAGLLLTGKGGNVLGFLCVNYRRRHEFYKEECQIIELFAEQAAVALEETYNHRSARSMAVAQERHHLAAELHHTLSQDLHGLKRFAQTALIYLERNEGKKARHNLTRITEVTSNSLDGLQEMLRNLHEELTEEVNFVAELKAHIQKLRQSYAVEIFFDDHVVGDASGQVQFYLLRIAMEAITNALRHARSQHISLVYRVDANGAVSLTIQDDGVGFDVAAARSNGRHGLGTMDYFAHKLNTQVKITSDIGTGTCVRVQFIPPKGGLK